MCRCRQASTSRVLSRTRGEAATGSYAVARARGPSVVPPVRVSLLLTSLCFLSHCFVRRPTVPARSVRPEQQRQQTTTARSEAQHTQRTHDDRSHSILSAVSSSATQRHSLSASLPLPHEHSRSSLARPSPTRRLGGPRRGRRHGDGNFISNRAGAAVCCAVGQPDCPSRAASAQLTRGRIAGSATLQVLIPVRGPSCTRGSRYGVFLRFRFCTRSEFQHCRCGSG